MNERKREGSWHGSVEKRGKSSDKERVPPFQEVLPQKQPKDNHVGATDPEVLWFIEYIPILLSTQCDQYLKDHAVAVERGVGGGGERDEERPVTFVERECGLN